MSASSSSSSSLSSYAGSTYFLNSLFLFLFYSLSLSLSLSICPKWSLLLASPLNGISCSHWSDKFKCLLASRAHAKESVEQRRLRVCSYFRIVPNRSCSYSVDFFLFIELIFRRKVKPIPLMLILDYHNYQYLHIYFKEGNELHISVQKVKNPTITPCLTTQDPILNKPAFHFALMSLGKTRIHLFDLKQTVLFKLGKAINLGDVTFRN